MGSVWIGVLVVTVGTAAGGRAASADTTSPTLDDAWFESLARSESLISVAASRGQIDSTDGAAVAAQIEIGVDVLGAIVFASVVADTVLTRPLATAFPREPHASRGRAILRATGVISAIATLGHLLAGASGASPRMGSVLGLIGGSAAGVSGVFGAWTAHSRAPPEKDSVERMRALGLETDLRVSIRETEQAAEPLWTELRAMALDSCATNGQPVAIARRYANALEATTLIVEQHVARTLAIARSCSECPQLAPESRERCGALASHLDTLVAAWHERSWLLERSKRNTLDFLILADRP